LVFSSFLFASHTKYLSWSQGDTLLTFLDKSNIPNNIYFDQSKTDKELCSEISAGISYQILYNEKEQIEQVLIPISEEMQLHIFKKDNNFILDIIPIEFYETTQTIAISIKNSPYKDIIEATANKPLANELMRTFKKTVNFKKMRKGDFVAIKFKQRIRMGQYFGDPKIEGALVEVSKRRNYIFKNKHDGRYYDDKARSLSSFFLKVPLRYRRISSKFSYKRWHPILKKYRAHLGIDYAAPIGRRINASADGKVIFKGRKGGYGKTIIIRHKNGYKSLYAHMHRYKRGIKVGTWVKQGTHIGYVGNTGRSTGPHLHFGLYKNGRAINPGKVIKITKKRLKGKSRQTFLANIKNIKADLLVAMKNNNKPLKLEKFSIMSSINI